jgi:hypothetical protein
MVETLDPNPQALFECVDCCLGLQILICEILNQVPVISRAAVRLSTSLSCILLLTIPLQEIKLCSSFLFFCSCLHVLENLSVAVTKSCIHAGPCPHPTQFCFERLCVYMERQVVQQLWQEQQSQQ